MIGQPGVRWAQADRLYNARGQCVDERGTVLDPRDKGFAPEGPVSSIDLSILDDSQLRAEAEVFNIPWTTRADVLQKLRGGAA